MMRVIMEPLSNVDSLRTIGDIHHDAADVKQMGFALYNRRTLDAHLLGVDDDQLQDSVIVHQLLCTRIPNPTT